MDYTCPHCRVPLTRIQEEVGFVWVCEKCGGCVATMTVLRRLIDATILSRVWRSAREVDRNDPSRPNLNCPSCGHGLRRVEHEASSDAPTLDVCLLCQMIWFDAMELDAMPAPPEEQEESPDDLPPRARELLGELELRKVQNQQRREEIARGNECRTRWGRDDWDFSGSIIEGLIHGLFRRWP
jgi:Zn-finger nucleic acid-binding protein